MADMLCKAGGLALTTAAATSTFVVNTVGFTPSVIFFWWSGRGNLTDGSGRQQHRRGWGMAVSTTDQRCVTSQSTDATANATTDSAHLNDTCIATLGPTGIIDGSIKLQSMDSGAGFTLVVVDALPEVLRVEYLALGGAITNAKTGQFEEPAAIGDQSTTDVGFQPDFLCLISSHNLTNPNDSNPDSVMMFGATDGTRQFVWSGGSNNAAATMQTISHCTDAQLVALFSTTVNSINARATFSSWLSNGFTLNWGARASTRWIHYLALKGGNYRVDNLLTQTNTTTDIVKSGFGFAPAGALFVSAGLPESATTTTIDDHDRWTMGAFSSTTARGTHGVTDQDAVLVSEVTLAAYSDAAYVNVAAGAVVGKMDVKSKDSDGFTTIMTDADPAQAFVPFIAFGPVGGGVISTKTGAATSVGAVSGADAITRAETGLATTAAIGTGADATTLARTGLATTSAIGTGAKLHEVTKAGVSVAAGIGTGAKSVTSGSATYDKVGVTVAVFAGAGADEQNAIETGAGIAVSLASGARERTLERSGGVLSA